MDERIKKKRAELAERERKERQALRQKYSEKAELPSTSGKKAIKIEVKKPKF